MYVYACLVRDDEGGSPILAIAPSNAILKYDDLVILKGEGSKTRRMLSEAVYIDDQSEEFDLIARATKLGKAMKIYGKYRFTEFNWEDNADE